VAAADKVVAVQVARAEAVPADKAAVEEDNSSPNKLKSFNRNKTGLIEAITSNVKPQTSN
jgi:hypothetical protein